MRVYRYFLVSVLLGLTVNGVAQGTWTSMDPMASQVGWGGTLEWTHNDYIYGFRGWVSGVGTREFYRYSISGDSWTQMTDFIYDPYWSAGLAWDEDDHIYAVNGNGNDAFGRYSISGDSWEARSATPETGVRNTGDALTWAGGDYIYLLKGNSQNYFWRYSISGDSWDWMTNAPEIISLGGALIWDGDQSLYAMRGHSDTDFWRYDIPADTWYTLAFTPDNISEGGSLTSDHFGYIYALQGDGLAAWRYSIALDSWTELASLPDTVRLGAALSWAEHNLYALQGDNKDGFWRFDCLDLEASVIVSPPDTIPADSSITPVVAIRNTGTLTASGYSVLCSIDSSGVNVYQETVYPTDLDPGIELSVNFPVWTAPIPGNCFYEISFGAHLTNDFDDSNDTVTNVIWVADPVSIEGSSPETFGEIQLLQNYPNPMQSISEITFRIPGTTRVELSVYDVAGRCVVTLMDGMMPGGEYSCTWNGRDVNGASLSNGLYIYRLRTDEADITRGLVLLR